MKIDFFRWIKILFIFTIIFNGLNFRLPAEEQQKKRKYPPPKPYHITPATSSIKIDGKLDEEAWQRATKIDVPFEWTPGDAAPAPVKTECMISYTRSNLYIAFRCFDPEPEKIRAHLMDRDSLETFEQDDYIAIVLDTFNDERRAFEFRVNPLGVQLDAVYSELDSYEDFSWDAIWKSAGKITDFGYNIEMSIPFNQIRFPKTKEEQTWGLYAGRCYPRHVLSCMSSHPRDRNTSCLLCQFNKLTGFKDLSPGHNLEFDPTLTLNRTDQREDFPYGSMEAGKLKVEPGITARWGITPNLILNAAINPDFSHVEADAAQLEVNTRFALRYPEKRPFFLEGADLFVTTPMEAVFTRTVFDPLWGVKTTGKIGRNAVGFFTTQDRYNNLIFPSNQGSTSTSIEENVFGGVFRYRRDVGKNSTLGVLYTGRFSDEYFNHVAGFDGFFRLSKTKTLNLQFLHSQTRYPEQLSQNFGQKNGTFGGNALFAQFLHSGRRFIYSLEYEDLSANFRADSGFIPRVDTRRIKGSIEPIIWGEKGRWFEKISFQLQGERITDHDNNTTNQDILLAANYQGPLQTVFQSLIAFKKELYNGITYDIQEFQSNLEIKPRGGLNFFISSRLGDSVDYSNSRLARSVLLNPGIEFGLGKHLNINLNHIFERLSTEGNKIYTANLLQTRIIYNFSVRSFIRAIVQYTHIDRDIDLYTFSIDPKTKRLFTQFLFSYKINPQTVLFIGYSDNHHGWPGIDLTRSDMTFFLKIGYALVL